MKKVLLLATTCLILTTSTPAKAAPLVGAIGLLGTGAGVSTIVGGALSMAASWAFQAIFAPETEQRGVKQETENGHGLPPHFIVGTYATPGTMLYQNVLNEGDIPNQCYVQVIGLSMLPVKGIQSRFFLQNEGVNINLTSNWPGGFKEVSEYVKGGNDGGYCLVKFHDGTQTGVDSWLFDKFKNDPNFPIHEDCWWRGCAYVIIQAWYSNRGIWTGWPEAKFVVEGIDLYDPRKDSSVGGTGAQRWNQPSTWSEGEQNLKVFEYNAIRGISYKGKRQWGGDAEAYRLPLEEWFAAMNACDEELDKKGGGTVKRGHGGAEIHFNDDPREIINEVNKSVGGYTSLIGGFYKTWCGSPGLPVMTITDDDFIITEDREDEYFKTEETYNTAYTYYPDAGHKWDMKDGPRVVDHDALEEDGEEFALDVQMPFLLDTTQVQHAVRGMLKDSKRQVTHRGQLPPRCFVLEPFDALMFISKENGYLDDGKAFRVDMIEDLPTVNQDALLREIRPADDAWSPEQEVDDPAADYGNVVPGTPVLDLTVFADSVDTATGKDRPAIRGEWSWGDVDIDVRDIDWRIRRTGTSKIIARGKIDAPEDGEALITHSVLRFGSTFDIQFIPAPYADRKIAPTAWKTVTMLPVDVPAGLELTVFSVMGADKKLDFFVLADWDQVNQRNDGYRVRITMDGRTRTFRSDDNQHTFPVSAPNTVEVSVATRASEGGTASEFCEPETVVVNKRTAELAKVTGLTARPVVKGFRLKWDPSHNDYHDQFGVFGNTIDNFATATFLDFTSDTTYLDDRPRARRQEMHYWVVDYDKAENAAEQSEPADAEYRLVESDDIDPDFKDEIDAKVQVVTDTLTADLTAMAAVYDAEIAAITTDVDDLTADFEAFAGTGELAAEAINRLRDLTHHVRDIAAQATFQGAVAYTQKEEVRQTLSVRIDDQAASFTEQIAVMADEQTAIAVRTSTLEVTAEDTAAALESLETTMVTADEAFAAQLTTMQAELDDKAEASVVTAIDTRVTSAEGTISSQASTITSIQASLSGKASASALSTLSATVTSIDGNVSSLATALTELTAGTTAGNIATARFKMTAESAPSGWTARLAMQVRAAAGGTYRSAGIYMDATAAASRIVLDTDSLVIQNGSLFKQPFVVSGGNVFMNQIYVGSAYIDGTLTASQISVSSLAALSVTAGAVDLSTANIGTLTAGTINIAGNAVSVSASYQNPASTVPVNGSAFFQLASVFLSWGSSLPQDFKIFYQFASDEDKIYIVNLRWNGVTVGSTVVRVLADAIVFGCELVTSGISGSSGTFTLHVIRTVSGANTDLRQCKIIVEAQKR